MFLLRWFTVCLLLLLCVARPALAHPMGNFSINHYARFEAQNGALKLRYILDFAEIPTSDQMNRLDANGDGQISAPEKSAYLKTAAPTFLDGLSLQLDRRKIALRPQSSDLETIPGAGGLPTLRVVMDTSVPLPNGTPAHLQYDDPNFAGRTGWKEIIAVAGQGWKLTGSDAAQTDGSRQLTIFPLDAGIVPPRQTSASFGFVAANAGSANAGSANAGSANAGGANAGTTDAARAPDSSSAAPSRVAATNTNTPQNRFTQSIAEQNLTPALVAWGLLFAFAFGAVHAFSPGHGKTMVAAYLVGSRGTPKHALTLGLVVTLTHTAGVFALGLAVLIASRYIVPEKLYAPLSALSGLLIFGVGLWLFMSRYQLLTNGRGRVHDGHSHEHDHHSHAHDGHSHEHGEHSHAHDDEPHVHAHDEAHPHEDGEAHSHAHDAEPHVHAHDEAHPHPHADGEAHSHAHGDEEHVDSHGAHSHSHGPGLHVHSHGGKAHSHAVPEGPITTKTLVALGISGGIVPCPEALVVLLAAVKLHRIGYGMVLITAFSLGLAVALIALGMLVVSARNRLSRFDSLSEGGVLTRYLPLGSAAVITVIGAILTLQATMNGP